MSNRAVAHRLGMSEKAIRKLVGPSTPAESASFEFAGMTTAAAAAAQRPVTDICASRPDVPVFRQPVPVAFAKDGKRAVQQPDDGAAVFTDGIEVVRSQAQAAAARSLPSPKFGDSSCARSGCRTLFHAIAEVAAVVRWSSGRFSELWVSARSSAAAPAPGWQSSPIFLLTETEIGQDGKLHRTLRSTPHRQPCYPRPPPPEPIRP
jgi:hypothetical protein